MAAVLSLETSPSLGKINDEIGLLEKNENVAEIPENNIKEQQAATGASYWNFIKTNYQFDLVWSGSIVSQTGDWLTEIACLTILGERGASSYMIAIYLISKDLPNSIWAPIAGVVADIFDRRKIMLASDLLRMVVVIGYLLIMVIDRDPVFVWALIGVSWSAVLLLGSGLGGLFSFFFGLNANFIADSITYLLSASLLSLLFRFSYNKNNSSNMQTSESDTVLQSISDIIEQDEATYKKETKSGKSVILEALLLWVSMMKNAFYYLRSHSYIMIICLVKFFGTLLWNSYDMAVINFAQQHFVMGNGGQLSLSILYATGGIGSWLGPFIATIVMPDTSKTNIFALIIGWWLLASGIFFSAFVPNIALLCVTGAVKSAGTALLWTFSDVIKDKLVPESILGRVSAFELALVPIATIISKLSTSWALENHFSPFHISFVIGMLGFAFSIIWAFVYLKLMKHNK